MLSSLLIAILFFTPRQTLPEIRSADRIAANRLFACAYEEKLPDRPMGTVISSTAKWFIGKPYQAGTLDTSETEQLVANLQNFDCVTFVENVLALARCIKSGKLSFEQYRNELGFIRYRGGILSGYTSRLHYFTGWIDDNVAKKTITDVTKDAGGAPYQKRINFMTAHRDRYTHLAADSIFRQMKQIEESLSVRHRFVLTEEISGNAIQDGDIIAIAADRPGLDVSHTGIAVTLDDGTIHLLHAPDAGQNIRITAETLSEYLRKHASRTGAIVLRPLEPSQ
jgi:hypothetical protein